MRRRWRSSKEDSLSHKRRLMVTEQLEERGIRDKRLLEVMNKVERHLFVPEEFKNEAYEDYPLPIGRGQTISQPYVVAAMTEALELKGDEKVLEIGTGSGYQAAILAELTREVCTIERDEVLFERAKKILKKLGYKNIKFRMGDGTLGWPEEAPFDRIIVTAAAPEIPPPFRDQLKEGGIMVIPVGERFGQILLKVKKRGDAFDIEELFECAFVPLLGAYGFREEVY
jgi:protein-L-isoaspartate(D-aspartate) O-methyltransferase